MESSSDQILLNFHDAVIKRSDVKLLQENKWLNDACIHFYFIWLAQKQKDNVPKTDDIFLDPSVVSFFMHQCNDEEDIEELVGSLSLPDIPQTLYPTKHVCRIFVAVSDNMAVHSDYQTVGGGTHWSLLLLLVTNDGLHPIHFDSISGSGNTTAAQDIVDKIARYRYNSACSKMVTTKTPKQSNGYDCGVHVLGAAKILAEMMPNSTVEDYEQSLQDAVANNPHKFCSDLRQAIVLEIFKLSALQEDQN